MPSNTIFLVCGLTVFGLFGLGCDRPESQILGALQGDWETRDATGQPERVHFDVQTVTYAHGTNDAFTCPYRVNAYHELESLIELRIKCKQRSGADAWIDYRLEFQPDRRTFTLVMDKRTMGTFRRALLGAEPSADGID